ncbi:hypothetical protein ASG95_02520 [Phycicoccus sp. Soil803]|nr:hypothetical protein ASG95_02520 [Phycicoccus sp. Soil803]
MTAVRSPTTPVRTEARTTLRGSGLFRSGLFRSGGSGRAADGLRHATCRGGWPGGGQQTDLLARLSQGSLPLSQSAAGTGGAGLRDEPVLVSLPEQVLSVRFGHQA